MLPSPHLMLLLPSHCLPRQPMCVGWTWASCDRLPLPQGSPVHCPTVPLPTASLPVFSAFCVIFAVLLCKGEELNLELIKSMFPELWSLFLYEARPMWYLHLGMEWGMQLGKGGGSRDGSNRAKEPTGLADPKMASQLLRGIRENCNVSGHVCKRGQWRYFSHIFDMALWPCKLLGRAVEQGGWLGGPWGTLKPCCTLVRVITV